MKNITYPSLLSKKARIFAGFKRADLIVIGISFITLSSFKLNGIISLSLMLIILFIFKFISSRIPKGFFYELPENLYLDWYKDLGRVYEK